MVAAPTTVEPLAGLDLGEDLDSDDDGEPGSGYTFEELDREEARMLAEERAEEARTEREAAWVEGVLASQRVTASRTSFGAPPPRAAEPEERAALDTWRALLRPFGLDAVDYGAPRGRGLVAVAGFERGDVMLRADAAALALSAEVADAFCHVCLAPRECTELHRCSGCKYARYCCKAHQRLAWRQRGHAAECSLFRAAAPRTPTPTMLLLAQCVELARAARGDAPGAAPAAAPAASEAARAPEAGAWPRAHSAVLALHCPAPSELPADRLSEMGAVAALTAQLLQRAGRPTPPDALLALLARFRANAHTLYDGELQPRGTGVYPLAALANHACAPSAVQMFEGPVMVVRALRRLGAGEELTISYIDLAAPRDERRLALRNGYSFECTCARCADSAEASSHERALAAFACSACGGAWLDDGRALGARGAGPPPLECARGCRISARELERARAARLGAQQAARELEGFARGGGAAADAAVERAQAAVAEWARVLRAPGNAWLLRARTALTTALIERGRWADAFAHARANEAACALAYGAHSANAAVHQFVLAKLSAVCDQPAEAARHASAAYEGMRHTHGRAHPLCAQVVEWAQTTLGLSLGT